MSLSKSLIFSDVNNDTSVPLQKKVKKQNKTVRPMAAEESSIAVRKIWKE